MQPIPCTIAVLTYNNEQTLERCLSSVRDVAEILVCDGGSTDATLTIAAAHGARILSQDMSYKDAAGKIIDFAGVRNQTLHAATYDWFFFLDSDEYLDSAIVDEIRAVVAKDTPGAYYVPRLYVVDGETITCASTYPSQQMRFFHRSVVTEFKKSIHERIVLRPGIEAKRLTCAMYVPLERDATALKEKWRRYLALEDARRGTWSFIAWCTFAVHESAVGLLYAYRIVRNQLFCRGTRMPLSIEWARLWYQYEMIRRAARAITRLI